MAKVRARKDNGMLFLDFYYLGTRCREQTALPDSAENRKKVQTLLNRIQNYHDTVGIELPLWVKPVAPDEVAVGAAPLEPQFCG